MHSVGKASALVALCAALASCEALDPVGPNPWVTANVDGLTPSVVASLSPNGFFPTLGFVSEPYQQLAVGDARSRAVAFVKTFGALRADDWSEQHGSTVRPSKLRPCGPLMVAEGAHVFPGDEPSASLATAVAGRFLQHFCGSDGDIEVLVSVSAGATVGVADNGELDGAPPANMFLSYGVPSHLQSPLVISAEAAARTVFELTGKRVSAIPRLESAPHPDAPYFARWRVSLESPATVYGQRSDTTVTVSVLYVGIDESSLTVEAPRLLRAVTLATDGDPDGTLADGSPSGPVLLPSRVRTGRPRVVERVFQVAP